MVSGLLTRVLSGRNPGAYFMDDLYKSKTSDRISTLEGIASGSPAVSPDFALNNVRNIDSSSGLNLEDACFGYALNPDGDNTAEVRIYGGEIHPGERDIIDVGSVKITIGTTLQYVWVEHELYSETAIITGPDVARPVNDATYFRKWLYKFALSEGGIASLSKIGNFGNIILPGAMA